jgi:hypothetical protein
MIAISVDPLLASNIHYLTLMNNIISIHCKRKLILICVYESYKKTKRKLHRLMEYFEHISCAVELSKVVVQIGWAPPVNPS